MTVSVPDWLKGYLPKKQEMKTLDVPPTPKHLPAKTLPIQEKRTMNNTEDYIYTPDDTEDTTVLTLDDSALDLEANDEPIKQGFVLEKLKFGKHFGDVPEGFFDDLLSD